MPHPGFAVLSENTVGVAAKLRINIDNMNFSAKNLLPCGSDMRFMCDMHMRLIMNTYLL